MTYNETMIVPSNIKKPNLKNCGCGAAEPPVLYAEGQARQYIAGEEYRDLIVWTEFQGYAVQCPSCRVRTAFCQTPEAAANMWNGGTRVH